MPDKLLVVYEEQPPILGKGRVVTLCLPRARTALLMALGAPDALRPALASFAKHYSNLYVHSGGLVRFCVLDPPEISTNNKIRHLISL